MYFPVNDLIQASSPKPMDITASNIGHMIIDVEGTGLCFVCH